MSVAGIDVGDAASCIALARKGGENTWTPDAMINWFWECVKALLDVLDV